MNILNISSSFGIGGREMLMLTITKELLARGENVATVTAPKSWLNVAVNENGFQDYSIRMRPYIDIPAIIKLGKFMQKFKPDIVHLYFITDIWLVIPAVKLFCPKAKIYLLRSMQSSNMTDYARTKLFNSIDKIYTMSKFLEDDFLSKTNISKERVEVLYIGVNPDDYKNVDENIFRDYYRISGEIKLIGLVGRIDRAKGHDKLIEAARFIVEKNKNVRFIIVGSSEAGGGKVYETELKNMIAKYNLADYFIFTGFRKDIPSVMRSLDIVVVPSKEESFGLVVIEAMCAGKPVVAFNKGALPEIVVDGKTGFIVDENGESLAAGVLKLLDDDDKIKEFGNAGVKRVDEEFHINTTIDTLLKEYKGEKYV